MFSLQMTWTLLQFILFIGDQVHSISPITPSELLIALHNIDCKEDESLMKATIKGTILTAIYLVVRVALSAHHTCAWVKNRQYVTVRCRGQGIYMYSV